MSSKFCYKVFISMHLLIKTDPMEKPRVCLEHLICLSFEAAMFRLVFTCLKCMLEGNLFSTTYKQTSDMHISLVNSASWVMRVLFFHVDYINFSYISCDSKDFFQNNLMKWSHMERKEHSEILIRWGQNAGMLSYLQLKWLHWSTDP